MTIDLFSDFNLVNQAAIALLNIAVFGISIWMLFFLRADKAGKPAAAFALSILFWIDINFLAVFPLEIFNVTSREFLFRLGFALLGLVFISAYFFAQNVGSRKRNRLICLLYILGWLVFMGLSYSQILIQGIKIENNFLIEIPGKAKFIFFVYVAVSLIAIYGALFDDYFIFTDTNKNRIHYIVSGPGLAAGILMVIYLVMPAVFGPDYENYAALIDLWAKYLAVIIIFFSAFGVFWQNLPPVRIILGRIFSIFIGITLFIIPFFESILWLKYLSFIMFLFFCAFAFLLVERGSGEFQKQGELEKEARARLSELMATKKSLEEAKTVLQIRVDARTKELQKLASNLDQQVKDRTAQLQKKVEELERANRLMVGREIFMAELKRENEELKKKAGQ